MTSGIYSIVNMVNGRRYIGSATYLSHRQNDHRRSLRNGTHTNRHLQRAWDKYGESAFAFEVLEECKIQYLVEREQWWMDVVRPDYNLVPRAGSNLGMNHTEEARHRMSEATKGRKFTDEHRLHLSESQKGSKATAEHRRHMSEALKGRKRSAEHRLHLSEAMKGHRRTAEHCRHISEAKKGVPWSEAQRAAFERRATP